METSTQTEIIEIAVQIPLPKNKTKIYTLNAVKAYYNRMKNDEEKYRNILII